MSMSEREDDKGGDAKGVIVDGDSKKTNGWKSLKEMKEYLRSDYEKKVSVFDEHGGETYLHFAAYLGDVDATKMLIVDNVEVNAVDEYKYTALHFAAQREHVDVVKLLIQTGADVNAVNKYEESALYFAALDRRVPCTLRLLCFGAEIDEQAIKNDTTELLRPIENRLKLLRNGNRMGTGLMSDEERRFMWNLACVLAIKILRLLLERIRGFVRSSRFTAFLWGQDMT